MGLGCRDWTLFNDNGRFELSEDSGCVRHADYGVDVYMRLVQLMCCYVLRRFSG